ncbi:unnamed protein product [Arctogadus glacialis]
MIATDSRCTLGGELSVATLTRPQGLTPQCSLHTLTWCQRGAFTSICPSVRELWLRNNPIESILLRRQLNRCRRSCSALDLGELRNVARVHLGGGGEAAKGLHHHHCRPFRLSPGPHLPLHANCWSNCRANRSPRLSPRAVAAPDPKVCHRQESQARERSEPPSELDEVMTTTKIIIGCFVAVGDAAGCRHASYRLSTTPNDATQPEKHKGGVPPAPWRSIQVTTRTCRRCLRAHAAACHCPRDRDHTSVRSAAGS